MASETLTYPDNQAPVVRRVLIIGGSFLGLVALAVLAFAVFQPIQVLPRIRLAPGFSLVGENGERLTSEDLRGHLVLYNFSYTRCPEPCGEMTATMKEVMARADAMNTSGIPFTLVTISFDPAYDTPERLKAYGETAGADPSRWHFATATDATQLKQLIGGGFEVYYNTEADGTVDFEPALVLVDGWGIIRGEYHYQTLSPDADRIVRHIGVLFDEIEKSQGAARYAYEAAHLFLCYAR